MNSPGVTSRSTSRQCDMRPLVPSAHTLLMLRQTTASCDENRLNGLETTQHPVVSGTQYRIFRLQQPHQPVGAETEQADEPRW